MLRIHQILVRRLFTSIAPAVCMVSLAACGQKGALYMPATPPGTQRATLPETLMLGTTRFATTPAPSASSPSPATTTP
ncbi:MAG: lipoprotein [Rhodoferax sp.]|nr:lipoprotein [Rhodoferax sp.]MBK7548940.1 lipoprotein [Rhodoferax sp.]